MDLRSTSGPRGVGSPQLLAVAKDSTYALPAAVLASEAAEDGRRFLRPSSGFESDFVVSTNAVGVFQCWTCQGSAAGPTSTGGQRCNTTPGN